MSVEAKQEALGDNIQELKKFWGLVEKGSRLPGWPGRQLMGGTRSDKVETEAERLEREAREKAAREEEVAAQKKLLAIIKDGVEFRETEKAARQQLLALEKELRTELVNGNLSLECLSRFLPQTQRFLPPLLPEPV